MQSTWNTMRMHKKRNRWSDQNSEFYLILHVHMCTLTQNDRHSKWSTPQCSTVSPPTNEHGYGSLHATIGCAFPGHKFRLDAGRVLVHGVKSLATGKYFQLLSHLHGIVSRFSHLTRIACTPTGDPLSLNKQQAPSTDGTSLFESDT